MFKEVLYITPELSPADLNKMEKSLGSRFQSIAKKFGKGLLSVLTGGGIAGVALGLVDKLLNPLKEVQEAIDKTLAHGNDLVTQAKQFNTTAGELAKLQSFGAAKGISPEEVNLLVEKFQTAVSEAVADPTKQTSVRQFVGQKDTAQGLFDFIQGLQKLDKNQQIQVQEEVFGAKQILKMSEFLNSDFVQLGKAFSGISTAKVTKIADKTSGFQDQEQQKGAVRNLQDFVTKGSLINQGVINSREEQAKRQLIQENKQLASFDSLSQIEETTNTILNEIKNGILQLTGMFVKLTDLANNVKKISDYPFMNSIKKLFGKGDK